MTYESTRLQTRLAVSARAKCDVRGSLDPEQHLALRGPIALRTRRLAQAPDASARARPVLAFCSTGSAVQLLEADYRSVALRSTAAFRSTCDSLSWLHVVLFSVRLEPNAISTLVLFYNDNRNDARY